jgi:tRNA nucleotidyltransferase/poly(A) polymerase
MIKKIKKTIKKIDQFFYKKFGSDKSIKPLENIKEVQIIFSHLNKKDEESKVRFVGGCIRKVLCGEIVDDIDLATSLEPSEIKSKLVKENIKVIDTGISHGTVTAILNEKKFEITTLREDISTDGRHASVEFTKNWNHDAARRDFTINAIYADIEGRIFDPLNGILDLKNGNIKFIGSPGERIQEDFLRILRYFRFYTQYSKTEHNQDIIKIIKKNINGLNKISNERIYDELKKILKLKKLYNLFLNDDSKDIFLNIFPQFQYYKRLKIVNTFNKGIYDKLDSILIIAILIIDDSNSYEYFCHKYRVSNKVKNRLKNISVNFEKLKSKDFYSETNIKKIIYFLGKDAVLDLLLFSICINNKVKLFNIKRLIDYVKKYKIPKFPFTGEYLKKQGYEDGKELGEKLKSLEEKWIANNFIVEK